MYLNVVKRFFITQVVIALGEVIDKYGISISPISMCNCLFMLFHIECMLLCIVLFTWK